MGLGGFGTISYIDRVMLRDDHDADWTAAADATLERRVYYAQNWRADVVALMADNCRVLERIWEGPTAGRGVLSQDLYNRKGYSIQMSFLGDIVQLIQGGPK